LPALLVILQILKTLSKTKCRNSVLVYFLESSYLFSPKKNISLHLITHRARSKVTLRFVSFAFCLHQANSLQKSQSKD